MDIVLVAGGKQDFETAQAKQLCEFLYAAGLAYQIIQQGGNASYVEIESQIEQSSTFLILIGSELDSSAWLNHCLEYAYQLSRIRMDRRPRLLGFVLPGWQLPASARHLSAHLRIFEDIDSFSASWDAGRKISAKAR